MHTHKKFNVPKESEMKELDKVVTKSFSRNDGPFVSGLDRALSSFYVERQPYYSGTFATKK